VSLLNRPPWFPRKIFVPLEWKAGMKLRDNLRHPLGKKPIQHMERL
jgi:hypothetical protein